MTDTDERGAWDLVGLSDLDQQVYRRLLFDPRADAESHGDALGCSAAQVRAALERLVSLGLVRRDTGTGDRYQAVDPLVGVAALVRERRHALDRLEAASYALSRVFAAGLMRAEPRRLFEVVEGPTATARRIHDLLGSARKEVVGIDSPPYVAPSSAHVGDAELGLLRRGVRFRSLYASQVLDEPALVARIQWMVESGEDARVLPKVPMKLLVVDRETAVVLLTGEETAPETLSIVAARSALTDGLQAMFEQLWSHASPIRFGPGGHGATRGRDVGTTELLDLLTAGMKDESIARHFGVSARTVRRRIGALLDELGATGRFQAGVRAVKRGLL
ncbi:helix-turn-helix domain-containing protein [Streptomyces chiangmaiensis]|uniref:Helix-turn-helix domain-containing protein n=1 Tax=Streptomyces chiangmaiensis TaxID=766497 RepID=A0ABU7FFX4_9ACTN|nr:helix-turn-helix domain-containing protein [Streptomyces chiangmaiensis]MED7822980.1 helix-turn-helix domain-containing protein [Streptomyces chiangmaiensis]